MSELTMEQAKQILAQHVTQEHLLAHSLAVSCAMGEMASHFSENTEFWRAVGYLHDVDFEKFPDEHCHHVSELLKPYGISDDIIHSIETHGWELCSDQKPVSNLEKSLYTVDELTGIIMAAAFMRPNGITDLEVKSAMKKFKDKRFAAKCNREVIKKGCEMLEMDLKEVMELCIRGMRQEADALGIGPKQDT